MQLSEFRKSIARPLSVRVEVRPSVLDSARALSGTLAHDDWDRLSPRFDACKTGGSDPTLKLLENGARKANAPAGFLFREQPPDEPSSHPNFPSVGDRPVDAGEEAPS